MSVALGELGTASKHAFSTGPFGSAISAKYFLNVGVPVIRGSNLSADVGHRLVEDDLAFIDEARARTFARSVAERGDLVFTCWGTIGQIGIIDDSSRFDRYVVSNKQMKMSPDTSRVDPLWLYYYLSQPRMISYVADQAIGSSVPGFNLGQLKQVPVELPELDEQRAIAEVLGALDDKIAANRQVVQSLFDLSTAQFQRIRITATKMVRLHELVTTQYGVTTSGVDGNGPRLIRVTDINKGPWVEWAKAPACDVDDATYAKYRLRAGDILIARMADPGKVAYVDEDVNAVFASYLIRLETDHLETRLYLYYFLNSPEYQRYADSVMGGSVQKNINAKKLIDTGAPIPALDALAEFNETVGPLRRAMASHLQENEKLAATRDGLLPLLMSGKLRVKDAEKQVGEVV